MATLPKYIRLLSDVEIEEITERICDSYCKYPELYLCYYHDPDEANENMMREKCEHCPLNEVIG